MTRESIISAPGGCKEPAIQGPAAVDLHCLSLYTIAVTKPPEFSDGKLSIPPFLYPFAHSFLSNSFLLASDPGQGTHNTYPSHSHSIKSPNVRGDVWGLR
jgi:hypothetical protein